jgi:excisionase family DNA binding protein
METQMPARRTAAVGTHTDSSPATVASDSGREAVNLAKRLRQLAERLPPGGSLTITRDALLGLTAVESCGSEHAVSPPDLTVAELGRRFHRSPSTIRDWCEHGRFEGAYKLNGRDWRVPQAAVDAFLAQQRRQPQEPLVRLNAWRATRHGAA